jgi:hypothetical protein
VNGALQSLIAVCNQPLVVILQDRLLFINRRWKDFIEAVQQLKYDQCLNQKRDEFDSVRTNLIERLEKVEREIHETQPCTSKTLKEQENRLLVNEITLTKLFVTIVASIVIVTVVESLVEYWHVT